MFELFGSGALFVMPTAGHVAVRAVPRLACPACTGGARLRGGAAILSGGQRLSPWRRVVSDRFTVFRPGVSACAGGRVSRVRTSPFLETIMDAVSMNRR